MIYEHMKSAIFKERLNRFIAKIEVDGEETYAHVKNTGRCKELLVPNARIFVSFSNSEARKTKYDLIGVLKGERLINMDSQAPNKVVKEWLETGSYFTDITFIKPEKTYGKSRFDFYIETKTQKAFIEVKGATLEENGVIRFPDAPTERGVKHILELVDCVKAGYEAYIIFVIQMKNVSYFTPNDDTHKAFGDALRVADSAGVKILAVDCHVGVDSLEIADFVDVIL